MNLKKALWGAVLLSLVAAPTLLAPRAPRAQGSPDPPFEGEAAADAFVSDVEGGVYGGTLSIIIDGDLGTLNPLLASGATDQDLRDLIFAGLTRYDNYARYQRAELAKSWTVSDDYLSWTFELRRGLRWSDGRPFNADDVLFTYQVVSDTSISTSVRDNLMIEGKMPAIEKVDDLTVRFRLQAVDALFLAHIGNMHIVPRHKWEAAYREGRFEEAMKTGDDLRDVVGMGPFRIVDYAPDEKVVYERNPYYWKVDGSGNRLPYFDRVFLVIVRDQNTQFLKFLSGEVDILESLRPEDFRQAKEEASGKNFSVVNLGPSLRSQFLCFNENTSLNPETGKPFADQTHVSWFLQRDFRRAVSHAVDRQSMVRQFLDGRGLPLYGFTTPAEKPWYKSDIPVFEYDLAKASALLDGIGFIDRDADGVREDREGNPIRFTIETQSENPTRVNMGTMIVDDLKRIGLDATLRPITFNSLVQKVVEGRNFDAFILGWESGIPPDPLQAKNILLSSGHLHLWHSRQKSPATEWEAEVDDLVNRMSQEVDEARRKELFDQVQVILAEEQPMIFLALPNAYTAIYNRIGNYKPTVLRPLNYHNAEELYRADRLVQFGYAARER